MHPKDVLGRLGEQAAVEHLCAAGLTIVDRNWRCATGEIDLVAQDGPVLVFCEVKARSSERFGTPAAAVTPAKLRRLRRLALAWLRAHGWPYTELRFDVVAVRWPPDGPPHVEHLTGVG